MLSAWAIFAFFCLTNAGDIELLECDPPDLPRRGGYGPVQEFYWPGDVIHYYCNTSSFIGGNYYRRCLDTGDWTGDTPVCDLPTTFASVSQTSIDADGEAERAIDTDRTTCTSTQGGQKDEWSGDFAKPGTLIRVLLFLPKGLASFEVVAVKESGEEFVCGSQTIQIDSFDWYIQNCPEPNNVDVRGIKIRSLSNEPLKICEIRATVLTSPKCADPHMRIESGRLRVDRHSAVLVCNEDFIRSEDKFIQCVREGVWNRKPLFCGNPL